MNADAATVAWQDATERLRDNAPNARGCVVRVLDGPDQGKAVTVTEGIAVIGTGTTCSLALTDTAVSREHLRVRLVPSMGIVVTDLGSTNGTRYLGMRVHEITVQSGAVFTVGRSRLVVQAQSPEAVVEHRTSYGSLVGTSRPMQDLYAVLTRLEQHEVTVLIQGETGVGKDRIAREIHLHSPRAAKPFVVFDCGAIHPNLIESQLFGHVRGSFTNADRDHVGAIEHAAGGTLFLNEIGELPLELQAKLLRVLEERRFKRVGETIEKEADVRVLAATHRELAVDTERGRFRSDLYYRLAVVTVVAPPLRERRSDIPLLLPMLLAELEAESFELSPGTLALLGGEYAWPGNVRELRNTIARALALGDQLTVSVTPLRDAVSGFVAPDKDTPFLLARQQVIDSFERDYLTHHFLKAAGNISSAARSAGLDRAYFRRLLVRYGLVD